MIQRSELLRKTANSIYQYLWQQGITVSNIVCYCGARVASIELTCGLSTGKAQRILQKDNCSIVRAYTEWQFQGAPQVFLSGRSIRVEIAWNDDNAELFVPLSSLSKYPHKDGTFTIGKLNNGDTLPIRLDDSCPHLAIIGVTGSGKSVLMQSAIIQLAPQVDLAIIDMKGDRKLREIASQLPLVAPIALDYDKALATLQWGIAQMKQRNLAETQPERKIIIVVDEVSDIGEDNECSKLLCSIAKQGRAAGVHLILSTQHAIVDAFGGSNVLKNLTGRLVGHVQDAHASWLATGNRSIDASTLCMKGDFFVCVPGRVSRVQVAYPDIEQLPGSSYLIPEWTDTTHIRRTDTNISAELWKAAIIAAMRGWGRKRFTNYCDKNGIEYPGDHARQSALPQEAKNFIESLGVCLSEDNTPLKIQNWPTEVI